MQTTRRSLFQMLAAAFVGVKAAPALADSPVMYGLNTKCVYPMMDELNAITLQHITPRLTDAIFVKSPLMYRLSEAGVMQNDGGGWKNISSPVDLSYLDDDDLEDFED
jgi:hypothetical protein